MDIFEPANLRGTKCAVYKGVGGFQVVQGVQELQKARAETELWRSTCHLSRFTLHLLIAVGQPPMVKQVLLSIAGVRTEVLPAKRGESSWAKLIFFWEIFFSQHPRDPHVNGHDF